MLERFIVCMNGSHTVSTVTVAPGMTCAKRSIAACASADPA